MTSKTNGSAMSDRTNWSTVNTSDGWSKYNSLIYKCMYKLKHVWLPNINRYLLIIMGKNPRKYYLKDIFFKGLLTKACVVT